MLCNSSLTLGPVHLNSNAQKQILQPSPPGLAGHLIDYHPFLSRYDATLAYQCLPGPILFALLLLSHMHIFPPKLSAWKIRGVISTLTRSVHAFPQPCAPLSDDFLVQH